MQNKSGTQDLLSQGPDIKTTRLEIPNGANCKELMCLLPPDRIKC